MFSLVACLSHSAIDHGSLSRRWDGGGGSKGCFVVKRSTPPLPRDKSGVSRDQLNSPPVCLLAFILSRWLLAARRIDGLGVASLRYLICSNDVFVLCVS